MAAAAAAETSELAKFLKEHSVHDVLAQALALKGLESIDDLAFAYPDLASLDSLLSGLSDEDMGLMGAVDPLHGVHAAKLRRSGPSPAYPRGYSFSAVSHHAPIVAYLLDGKPPA